MRRILLLLGSSNFISRNCFAHVECCFPPGDQNSSLQDKDEFFFRINLMGVLYTQWLSAETTSLGDSIVEEQQTHSWICWAYQLLGDPLTFGWWLFSFLFLSFSFKFFNIFTHLNINRHELLVLWRKYFKNCYYLLPIWH